MPRVGSTQRPGTPVLEQPETLQTRQQPRHLTLIGDTGRDPYLTVVRARPLRDRRQNLVRA